MIRIIMFDFDGTVIDTMKEYAELASLIIHRYTGISRHEAMRLYQSTAGMDFPSQLIAMGITDETTRKTIYRDFLLAKNKILERKKIEPIVQDFLIRLRDIGFHTILSTNNECHLIENIEGVDVFEDILCFDGVSFRKGRPHLNYVKRKYNARIDEILFIGDTVYDLKVYSVYGVRTLKTRGLFHDGEPERMMRLIKRVAFKKM